MRIPDGLRPGVEAALADAFGRDAGIASVEAVGGGCISPSARVETAAGDVAFLKWREPESAVPGLFAREAEALGALGDAGAVRTPAVLGLHDPDGDAGGSWLLLEWLEPGSAGAGTWGALGHGLAALHGVRAERYGWHADTFVGPLVQENGQTADWPRFWAERRILPQLGPALDSGHLGPADRRRFERLLERMEEVLEGAEADGASLLHGDLWYGNVHPLADGTPALVDPASYFGHREADLAMAELFGGFDPAFFRAYEEAWPLLPGYRDRRRPVYQLYYLLVHVNLFGAGYADRTRRALAAVPL